MSLNGRLDRLERGRPDRRGFFGSLRFFNWLCGSYEPTPEELAEWDRWQQDNPLPPEDRVERELAALLPVSREDPQLPAV